MNFTEYLDPVVDCMNASQIKEQVLEYCTGTMPKTTLWLVGIGLLFFTLQFFGVLKIFRSMNMAGIINLRVGWSQLLMTFHTHNLWKSLKTNIELANFVTFITLLLYSTIIFVCLVAVMMLTIRNYAGG